MPQLRQDPVSHVWVIIAEERGSRPSDFVQPDPPDRVNPAACAFCPGNESKTPPEVYAQRPHGTANQPGWHVRAVPNKFPALATGLPLKPTTVGHFHQMNGVGRHEVIIDSPDHDKDLADLSNQAIVRVVTAYRDRLKCIYAEEHEYALLFKNKGKRAGASLSHPHTQLIGLPMLPPAIAHELTVSLSYRTKHGRCLFCGLIEQTQQDQGRVVETTDEFIVFTPFAPRFPYEMRIFPRRHSHDFASMTSAQVQHFGGVFKRTLQRLKLLLKDPPYNIVLHTTPDLEFEQAYHWHVEILPHLTRMAGFEWGSGMYINPTAPEQAAESLRNMNWEDASNPL